MAETKLPDATFLFELVSPEKVLVSERVSMVEIPGELGNFGVLAGHAPLLSALRPGVVTVTSAGGSQRKIYVAGGFADVNGDTCALLAEEATAVEEIDTAALATTIADLEDDLTFAKEDPVKAALVAKKIASEKAKLDVIRYAA